MTSKLDEFDHFIFRLGSIHAINSLDVHNAHLPLQNTPVSLRYAECFEWTVLNPGIGLLTDSKDCLPFSLLWSSSNFPTQCSKDQTINFRFNYHHFAGLVHRWKLIFSERSTCLGASPKRKSKNDDDLIESKLKNDYRCNRSPVLHHKIILFQMMISEEGASVRSQPVDNSNIDTYLSASFKIIKQIFLWGGYYAWGYEISNR